MVERGPEPRLELLSDPVERKRVVNSVSCTDCDAIEKVDGAGEVTEIDGVAVQRMHNGVLVEAGAYGGQWETEIIRSLRGHHEPQEELVFDTVIRSLAGAEAPRMIELGCFWSYYSIWFARALPAAEVVALEPDPINFETGRRNARLNGVSDSIEFIHGAIGAEPGRSMLFRNESDDGETELSQYDLASLLAVRGWDRVDVLHVDVQGFETVLIERAAVDLRAGRVRFAFISTHHHAISGDALTHQRVLAMLVDAGAHVIAEHSVGESFSGDGLIAVSFDERDRDLVVPISYSRARDTMWGELEWALDGAHQAVRRLEATVASSNAELSRIRATRAWRWLSPIRAVYRRMKSVGG